MFALRRAAAKAVFTQPTRHLPTFRPASKISQFQIENPILYRSFHQSRRWLAEEEQKKPVEASPTEAQTSGETVTTEPSEAELKESNPETIAKSETVESAKQSAESAAETVQAKAQETASQAQSTASKVTERAQDFVSSAAETVQNVASRVVRTPREQWPPRDSSGGQDRRGTSGKILYIGNIFFEVSTAQLEAEFARYGEVVNSRVVTDSQGLSKGFGYIEFANQESAERAVREQDQQVFQGRRMAVQFHVPRVSRSINSRPPRTSNPPSKTLFIGNMSYQMSDKDLNDLFKNVRDVLDVRVAIDRRSGQPRGFAHADFVDIASAERAKASLEQQVVYGRQLRIDFSASTGGGSGEEPR